MNKQAIFFGLAFTGLFVLHLYDIRLLHDNIKKVRKEAWFDANRQTDSDVINIKFYLEHLEERMNRYHGPHPDYPEGYPIWDKKEKEIDPITDYLIDKCL